MCRGAGGIAFEDPIYPSDEYYQWYRERTVLYVSNLRTHPILPEGFQGESAKAEYLMDAMSRLYYMALDSVSLCDDQHRGYLGAIRDFASTSLQHVGESWQLALRPPHIPEHIPRHQDPRRVQRAPRKFGGGQHGGGHRCRVQSPESIF